MCISLNTRNTLQKSFHEGKIDDDGGGDEEKEQEEEEKV